MGVFMILSLIASSMLKSRFRKFSKIPTRNGLSGAEVAQRMLNDHGCHGVKLKSVEGELTDHYNPATKTVNLSPDVYHGRNVAAAAVAAHEVGHAVQHAESYAWLQMRSALVPLQNVSSKVLNFIFIAMFLGSFLMSSLLPLETALMIIIASYGVFTLFSLITLPVEFNASNRALAWLSSAGVTSESTQVHAKSALGWAASTYVIAALSSLASLLYYVALLAGSRRD